MSAPSLLNRCHEDSETGPHHAQEWKDSEAPADDDTELEWLLKRWQGATQC